MTAERIRDRESAKRRIMFVAGEDFYFLSYTLFLLLNELHCSAPDRALLDGRKVAYLADLVGSASDATLATSRTEIRDADDRARLALIYDRAAARRAPVERLLSALARKELIGIETIAGGASRIWLPPSSSGPELVKTSLYDAERQNIQRLRSYAPQLRTMTLETTKDKFFAAHGVRTWAD